MDETEYIEIKSNLAGARILMGVLIGEILNEQQIADLHQHLIGQVVASWDGVGESQISGLGEAAMSRYFDHVLSLAKNVASNLAKRAGERSRGVGSGGGDE